MLKEKASKKRLPCAQDSKRETTLDARHLEMIQGLTSKQRCLEDLVNRHQGLEATVSTLRAEIEVLKTEGEIDTQGYDDRWTQLMTATEEMRRVRVSIEGIESNHEEISYYEDTGKILFQYYDVIEKQGTSTHHHGLLPRPVQNARKVVPPLGKDIIEALSIHVPADPHHSSRTANKSSLVDEYLSATDSTYMPQQNDDGDPTCARCAVLLLCLQGEGVMVCPSCGAQEVMLAEQNRATLRPSPKDSSHMSYKRINHLIEWISQIQGKETTEIPEDVFERILAEIKKEKLEPSKITHSKMREILRRLHLNRFYEHSAFLMQRVTGITPPHFGPELEARLCRMFREIQPAFVRHCPKHRRNFLSYSLCLHVMFRILGQEDESYLKFLPYFPLLRARDKLYAQQEILKAICKDLGWPFFPCI